MTSQLFVASGKAVALAHGDGTVNVRNKQRGTRPWRHESKAPSLEPTVAVFAGTPSFRKTEQLFRVERTVSAVGVRTVLQCTCRTSHNKAYTRKHLV